MMTSEITKNMLLDAVILNASTIFLMGIRIHLWHYFTFKCSIGIIYDTLYCINHKH